MEECGGGVSVLRYRAVFEGDMLRLFVHEEHRPETYGFEIFDCADRHSELKGVYHPTDEFDQVARRWNKYMSASGAIIFWSDGWKINPKNNVGPSLGG